MIKEARKHLLYYSVSLLIFAVTLLMIMFNNYSNRLQLTFIVMAASLYFIWSMIHHYIHHQLHHKIVIEYALIIILGVVLSFFLFGV